MTEEEKIAEVERTLDNKRIIETDYCHECGRVLEPFTDKSEYEMIIRRYMGGQGHLIDLGFHTKCYDKYRQIPLMLGAK
jgi:hypothetical protein